MDAAEELVKKIIMITISKASEEIIVTIPFHRPLRRKEEENQHYLKQASSSGGQGAPRGQGLVYTAPPPHARPGSTDAGCGINIPCH